MGITRAAFWIVGDNGYIKEADRSAASLRRHHPDIEYHLFTPNVNAKAKHIRYIHKMPKRQHEFWYLDSTRYFLIAGKQLYGKACVYLDSDTHICEPIDDLWRMLERYDFAGAYAPGRQTQDIRGNVPATFPEINIGVLAFYPSAVVIKLFENWYEHYFQNEEFYRNNDQAPLRHVLWQGVREGGEELRLGILPIEWNLRFGFGTSFRGKVRVLHGRGDYEGVCMKVNGGKEKRFRSWKQGELT